MLIGVALWLTGELGATEGIVIIIIITVIIVTVVVFTATTLLLYCLLNVSLLCICTVLALGAFVLLFLNVNKYPLHRAELIIN